MRVLKWIIERARGHARARQTPLGLMPSFIDLDWRGLDFSMEDFTSVMSLDRDLWLNEIEMQGEFLDKLGDRLPKEIALIRELLTASLRRSPEQEFPAHQAEPMAAAGTAE